MADADYKKLLFSAYDVTTATDYTYGKLSDLIQSPKYLTTSGSSTTVSELNATDQTFLGFGVGDILYVNVDGAWTSRPVTDVSGAPDSVTVGTAVDWQNGTSGRAFSYRRFSSGTASTDGWFPVAGDTDKSVHFSWDVDNAASVDVTIEGRVNGGTAATLYTKNFTAIGAEVYVVAENVTELRVGVKVTTDAGTNTVSATYTARRAA